VPEPRKVDFKPKWMTTLSPEQEAAMDAFEGSGSLPTEPPRIDTRILPHDQGYTLSLRSLSEVAALTQKLADYAGYDAVHGPNPDFADLRSLSADLTRLTRLTSEPFAPGSFIIPACLQADPLEVVDGQTRRRVETDDVARRFGEVLTLLDTESAPTGVSIGALQTLEALARVLNREDAGIEFSAADSFRKPLVKFQIGERFIGKVREVLGRRRPSQDKLEMLAGRVTALDVVQGTLLLSVQGLGRRVKSNFPHMFVPSLLEALNRQVKLQGIVERRGREAAVIHIHSVEIGDAEEPA
jgi:hypothetical protein